MKSRRVNFGVIAILALLYVGLMLLGRTYGPGGPGGQGGGHTNPDSLDIRPRDGRTPPENGPIRSHGSNHSGGHDRSGDPNRSRDGNRSGSVRSFLLSSTAGYLALLAVWAGLRRKRDFLLRHGACAAAMWLLVVQYLTARGGFEYNVHTWNRSFADASVVLYAVTLAIGPLARIWPPARNAMAWRRETAIWGTLAAAVHIGLFWGEVFGWDGWRAFFYPGGHGAKAETLMGDRSGGLLPTAFNLANVVGLVALVYAFVLTVTSNDAGQRWLKRGWSWLQERATTMQVLVLLHTWLFAYYITDENLLAIGTLWAGFWAVLLLQTAAFIKTVWVRPRPQERPSHHTDRSPS